MHTEKPASKPLKRRQLLIGGGAFILFGVFFLIVARLRPDPLLHWPALTLAVVCGARGLWYGIMAMRRGE